MHTTRRRQMTVAFMAASCAASFCGVATANPYRRAVLADKPVAYYRFDETSGPTAADATGNGHDGAYRGGVSLGEPSAYSYLGTAAEFGAKGSRVQIPAHRAFQFGTGDFSVEFWFNCREALSTRGDIFTYKGEGKDIGIFKAVGAANLISIARPYRAFQAQTDPFSIGTWCHAVYVRRAGVDQWYLDGPLSGTATGHRLSIDMNVDLLIGANHTGDPNDVDSALMWNGLIDELAIYDSALSARQVEAHFKAARQPPVR